MTNYFIRKVLPTSNTSRTDLYSIHIAAHGELLCSSYCCPLCVRYLFGTCPLFYRTYTGHIPDIYRTCVGDITLPYACSIGGFYLAALIYAGSRVGTKLTCRFARIDVSNLRFRRVSFSVHPWEDSSPPTRKLQSSHGWTGVFLKLIYSRTEPRQPFRPVKTGTYCFLTGRTEKPYQRFSPLSILGAPVYKLHP